MERFLYVALQALNVLAIGLVLFIIGWIVWQFVLWIRDEIDIRREKRQ